MNSGKEFVFLGPEIIWLFYLPYVHGPYYILNQSNITSDRYLFGYLLLLNNCGITVLIYLTIKLKQRFKK